MESTLEQWLPVVGHEGIYSVSSLGRIRSEPRAVQQKDGKVMNIKGRVLKPYVMKAGYHIYDLRKDNVAYNHYGHAVVLEAFVGPRPTGYDACHNNGQRGDNRLENLRWDTRKANHHDKIAHGTALRNERNPRAKLKDSAVRSIRVDPRKPEAIASEHGIHWRTVYAIKSGKYRKYLP